MANRDKKDQRKLEKLLDEMSDELINELADSPDFTQSASIEEIRSVAINITINSSR